MPGENHENADVEKIRSPHQFPPPQQLARTRFPGVLLALEPQQAAEQENGQRQIGIPAERRVVEKRAHDRPPWLIGLSCVGTARRAWRIRAASASDPQPTIADFAPYPSGPAPKVTASSSQAASSALRSLGSRSGSASTAARSSA